jgi:hypothetical protein
MKKIFIPTSSPEDWKRLLAKPEKHWKNGYSAQIIAEAWEHVNGDFPLEIKTIFTTSEIDHFSKVELLLAFPEWKVYLPPRGHPSQNDVFVLGRDAQGNLLTLMVEAKVAESFGERLESWLSTPGRQQRLDFIQSKLGLATGLPPNIRYQFLHRAVSAVVEAERFRAKSAIMLIHSFSKDRMGFADYVEFLKLFGVNNVQVGKLYLLTKLNKIEIYAGWVDGKLDQDPQQHQFTS